MSGPACFAGCGSAAFAGCCSKASFVCVQSGAADVA